MAQYSLKQLLTRALPVEEGTDQITIPVSDSNLVNFSEIAKEGLTSKLYPNGLVVFVTIKKSDGASFTKKELEDLGLL